MTIGVSDHALLRFLSRAGGFDLETLRKQMQAALTDASAAAQALGQSRYTVKMDGMIFVVENGVCITMMAKSEKPFLLEQRR